MSELILRPASEADIPALSKLGIDSFIEKFGHMYTAQDLATFLEEAFSLQALAAEMSDPEFRRKLIALRKSG